MLIFSSTLIKDFSYTKPVIVETSISDRGLPTFEIFGLITKSIEESKKRIVTAFETSGINFPLKSIKVNLAPSEIAKDGTHFDLSISASILKYTSSLDFNFNKDLFIGELSFNGDLRRVDSCMYFILIAAQNGYERIFIPYENLKEIKTNPGITVIGIKSILSLINGDFEQLASLTSEEESTSLINPFTSIVGNEYGKKVLSYSIAGKHHLLLDGFPGSGKSMLVKSANSLHPMLQEPEIGEVLKVFSYCGIDPFSNGSFEAPFRNPHSSSSYSAVFGSSGKNIYPGEVALANKGILFLDELPEFNRQVIEGLRSPLEDKYISISRVSTKLKFETDFILMATMNPCKCGYFNHSIKNCKCTPFEVLKYKNKISGPIQDRIDIYINFNDRINISSSNEQENYSYEKFLELKKLISEVRFELNYLLSVDRSRQYLDLNKSTLMFQKYLSNKTMLLLNNVQENYSLSNRKVFKILKLSLTISLFKKNKSISEENFLEALSLVKKE